MQSNVNTNVSSPRRVATKALSQQPFLRPSSHGHGLTVQQQATRRRGQTKHHSYPASSLGSSQGFERIGDCWRWGRLLGIPPMSTAAQQGCVSARALEQYVIRKDVSNSLLVLRQSTMCPPHEPVVGLSPLLRIAQCKEASVIMSPSFAGKGARLSALLMRR